MSILGSFGIARIGEKPVRHVAVKTRFGRPVSLVRIGLTFCIGGVHGFWRVPTGKYNWNYVIEGNTKDGWWLKVVVRVDFNWPTPNPDDPDENPTTNFFPFVPKGMINRKVGFSYQGASEQDVSRWPKRSSWFLLRRAFYRFPKEPIKTTVAELQEFFRGSITGAILTILGEINIDDFVGQQEVIEAAAKVMALSSPGDPCVDCGIPANCLNIKIVKAEPVTEGAKENREAPERARNLGEAHKRKMQSEKEAASDEAERIREVTKAYIDAGADPEVAPILASAQVKGAEKLSLDDLMAISIIRGQFGGRIPTVEQIVARRRQRR